MLSSSTRTCASCSVQRRNRASAAGSSVQPVDQGIHDRAQLVELPYGTSPQALLEQPPLGVSGLEQPTTRDLECTNLVIQLISEARITREHRLGAQDGCTQVRIRDVGSGHESGLAPVAELDDQVGHPRAAALQRDGAGHEKRRRGHERDRPERVRVAQQSKTKIARD